MSFRSLVSSITSRTRRDRRRNMKQPSERVAAVQSLESRQLMTAVAAISSDTLEITGTTGNDKVEVAYSGSSRIRVKAQLGGRTTYKYFSRSAIDEITFVGDRGNDEFTNKTSLPSRAYGGRGNDTLRGGSGVDRLYGQWGEDKLYGNKGNDLLSGGSSDDFIDGGSGHDKLWGSSGDDTLLGGSGNDKLYGGSDDDHLNGQAGLDKMWGQSGDDVLIAIDNSTSDYVSSGTGEDVIWVDGKKQWFWTFKDRMYKNSSADKVQTVTKFSNSADKTLNGDNIKDPNGKIVDGGTTYGAYKRRFSNNPLFASSGPSENDVRQGAVGDCYFLAGVSAIAEDKPHVLRQNIVDFNDGTYGVRMGSKFYRVDSQLPTNSKYSSSPSYAQLGRQNSMWVAIAEKAWAHHRKGKNSYSSIEGGWSVEAYKAFGAKSTRHRSFQNWKSATSFANEVYSRWNTYQAVTIGFTNGGKKKKAVGDSTIVLGHMYSVSSVKRNSKGAVTKIVLRNPWGYDGGKVASGKASDGLVTLTPSQLWGLRGVGYINSGIV